MKTLGAVLLIIGLLVSLVGYGQHANVVCHCPAQTIPQPFNCSCDDNQEQRIGHIMTYVGLVISGVGILLFVYGWRSKIIK